MIEKSIGTDSTSSQSMISDIPLVVDLDGTLINTDLLVESALSFSRFNALKTPLIPLWLLKGKAFLKEKLAIDSQVDVSCLPYNKSVVAMINSAREQGRQIILATASHISLAERVAEHLRVFDHVIATTSNVNLSRERKRDSLVALFGEKGFDYIGNSHDDLSVWEQARIAHVVNPEIGVERAARKNGNIGEVLKEEASITKLWLKALRLHQWLKNILVFVPLLASHQLTSGSMVLNGILSFICFGLCASSVYVLNDLLDLTDDRHHPSKRNRPFASGQLSVKVGLLVFPVFLALSFTLSLNLLPPYFSLTLAAYYLLTLAYSLCLKRVMMLDVITLGMLYTLRIIAGAFALPVSLTFWMLAFSMFIFLSLALVKRYAELKEARDAGKSGKARGRAYFPDDLEMISALGSASGYLSVMVLALYIQDDNTISLYRNPEFIWLSCPLLLFWVSRTWMLTHRGLMHDDPVVFAIKDRSSLLIGALFVTIFWLAT